MDKFYRLEQTVSAPGSTQKETVKNFYSEKKAVKWLETNGYTRIADRWENKVDHDPKDVFDVWTYIKIIESEIE